MTADAGLLATIRHEIDTAATDVQRTAVAAHIFRSYFGATLTEPEADVLRGELAARGATT